MNRRGFFMEIRFDRHDLYVLPRGLFFFAFCLFMLLFFFVELLPAFFVLIKVILQYV